jgi:hypothetical protein
MIDAVETPEFAKSMLDFNRLLEGENRESAHPDDADHWYAVYADLVGFKEKLLKEVRGHIQDVPDTKLELAGHDVPFLEAELGRLRSGMAYWASRKPEARRREGPKPVR